MRVLIVGGTGFVGPSVVLQLAQAGHAVAVFHRGHHEFDFPPGVEHFHSELAEYPVTQFPREVITWAPDVVLHMVAMGEADAEAFVKSFRSVARRSVVISSGDVYRAYGLFRNAESGPVEPLPLTEASALRISRYPERRGARNPEHWVYNYDKVLVEQVVNGDSSLPATLLRLPKVYGPRDSSRRLFPYIKRMADQRPAIVLQEGYVGWRFTSGYVDNVAAAIVLAITDDRAAGRTYNVGEPVTPTNGEWIELLGQAFGWAGDLVGAPDEILPPTMRYPYRFEQDVVMDSTLIRKELGYREIIPIETGMLHTVEWEKAMLPERMDAGQFNYRQEDQVLDLMRGI